MLPRLDAEGLPDDIPLVIRTMSASRRRIAALAEIPPRDSPYDRSALLLALRDSQGVDRDLARAEGHGRWIQSLPRRK